MENSFLNMFKEINPLEFKASPIEWKDLLIKQHTVMYLHNKFHFYP